MSTPRTLFRKIWDAHVVAQPPGAPAILYIDRHYIHEVTSPQAFYGLSRRGRKVRRPDRTVATADHSVPTGPVDGPADPQAVTQVAALETNCRRNGIVCFGPGHPHQGIVHVIGPELGLTLPGMTVVCGDSLHRDSRCTGRPRLRHRHVGSGAGSGHPSRLLQVPSMTCRVEITGRLQRGVTAKDLVLAIVAALGTAGGTGYVLEYAGAAVRGLSVEERMTICNMSIEAAPAPASSLPTTPRSHISATGRTPRGAGHGMRRWPPGGVCRRIRMRCTIASFLLTPLPSSP